MFTGIVTQVGRVAAVEGTSGAGRRLLIEPAAPLDGLAIGASVAHGGVCLTVTAIAAGRYSVEASPETLARTTLAHWRAGTRVNLERSLRLGDELGGHLVFGHVDAVGRLTGIEPLGTSRVLRFAMPAALDPLVAVKGSIAVDGVSLTVNEVGPGGFAVTIIPHTWDHTTLAELAPGDPVNLEVDMLARYVARQIALRS